ncbi:hypothetical protein T439DRAFT_222279 [Meredithblackwellia eburnea MCA 4105]
MNLCRSYKVEPFWDKLLPLPIAGKQTIKHTLSSKEEKFTSGLCWLIENIYEITVPSKRNQRFAPSVLARVISTAEPCPGKPSLTIYFQKHLVTGDDPSAFETCIPARAEIEARLTSKIIDVQKHTSKTKVFVQDKEDKFATVASRELEVTDTQLGLGLMEPSKMEIFWIVDLQEQ